jgi:hypothetical protein
MGCRTKNHKTKKERQSWWNSLSSEAKEMQIAKWQKQKERRRRNRPPKVQRISRKYPWINPGVFVDDSNRVAWKSTILEKNPWLLEA